VPGPLTSDHSVELAVVERDGIPESRHLGAAVLVDADGRVVESLGDTRALIYPRSAVKPLQATAMLRLGAPLTGAHLAIAQASHFGTPVHVGLVDDILGAAGLDRTALRCPESWPRRSGAIRGLEHPERVTMTCSGKHAGFLSAAVRSGSDPATYLDREHPVQREVARVIAEFAGEPVAHWGVDGCLAPTPVLSMTGFARAIGAVLRAHPELADAARTAPWAIDDEAGENAVVISELGAFAKTGAEGVMVIALASGETVVTKALDGSERVGTAVALELLARTGLVSRESVVRILDAVGHAGLRIAF
jgi:L-asparaginase II